MYVRLLDVIDITKKAGVYSIVAKELFNLEGLDMQSLEEQKTGHWINKSHQSGCGIYFIDYRCSGCDDSNDRETKFCPNCGAKMIEEK